MRKFIIIICSMVLMITTSILACNSGKQPSSRNEGIVDTTTSQENVLLMFGWNLVSKP